MTECLTWEGAKVDGEPRGLILHGECPVNEYCRRVVCFYVSTPEEMAESFKTKEEKDADLQAEIDFYLKIGELAPEATQSHQSEKFLEGLRKHFEIADTNRLAELRRELRDKFHPQNSELNRRLHVA